MFALSLPIVYLVGSFDRLFFPGTLDGKVVTLSVLKVTLSLRGVTGYFISRPECK